MSPNKIDCTGIRPGEKLFEELYFDDEQTLPTSHPKVRAAYARPYTLAEARRAVSELAAVVHEPEAVIRRTLTAIVSEQHTAVREAAQPPPTPHPSKLSHEVLKPVPGPSPLALLAARGAGREGALR